MMIIMMIMMMMIRSYDEDYYDDNYDHHDIPHHPHCLTDLWYSLIIFIFELREAILTQIKDFCEITL